MTVTETIRESARDLRSYRVFCVIPAHNEAAAIADTIASIRKQTILPDRIIVVCDNCTDSTQEIAELHGCETYVTVGNTEKKAGALNQVLVPMIDSDELSDDDRVLVMDADSELTPHFTENALAAFQEFPDAGGISAAYLGKPELHGFLPMMQRIEYAHERRRVGRKKARVNCLSGTAAVFSVAALRHILAERRPRGGLLPGYRKVYLATSLTEDFEITLALKKLGYTPRSPRECLVYTDLMPTLGMLWSQRLRWQRGTLETLKLYGLNKITYRMVLTQVFTYVVSLASPLMFLLWGLALGVFNAPLEMKWWIGALLPLSSVEQAVATWRLRSWKATLLAASLVPLWLFDQYRSAIYWWAVLKALKRTEFVWE